MSSYLDELNDVQRQAVTTIDGPVLVVAGPGSGKTRVLTYRIAYIIEQGAKPYQILALTFTNKAAREMKDRIGKVVGDKANNIWAGTFHSIFARILRVEASKIGYDSNFTIYDTEDSKSLIKSIIKEMNLDSTVYNVNAVRSRISSAKSNIITPKAYKVDEELRMQDRMSKRPYIADIYEKYMVRCKKAGAMDFDDLLYQLYRLFYQNPDNVLAKYQEKFKYILVDEYQDTNVLQSQIIKKLLDYRDENGVLDKQRQRNICVVGDDAQSIYAFRGATIENILSFERDYRQFGVEIFKLELNYRSTEHIVQAANELITHNDHQIQKSIQSIKGSGQKIRLIRAMTDAEEGKRVADNIVEQKNRLHFRNKEIAILYRTNSQSRVFEEYLRRYNVPYRVYGGLSFYQRKEVKDLIAYLRLTLNQNDEEALRRIINYPKRAIGKSTVDKISEHAAATNTTMWESMTQLPISARAKNALVSFKKMMMVFINRVDTMNAYELASYIARQSGLIDLLKRDTTVEGMGRLENINALLDGIKDFVENDEIIDEATMPDKSLASYLQNIALLTDLDKDTNSDDYVTLMSVHSAKGLEFKSVFVVGLEEKLFPSFMSIETKEGVDEERRLFYVAITRAEQMLTLSFANSRYKFGQMRYEEPSRFLMEIPPAHLESSQSIRKRMAPNMDEPESRGAKIVGNFKKKRRNVTGNFAIDPKNFKPSISSEIQAGMKVLHMRFGEGKVLNIDGAKDNRVATIFFKAVEDDPQKRIMLKFAKLQIVQ